MNVIHKIRLLMESNDYLIKLVPVIQNTRIMRRRTNAFMLQQSKKNDTPQFRACYAKHKDQFEKLAGMLADDFSRKTLRAVIDFRLDPAADKLGGVMVSPQYFMPDIFGPAENEVFVDGGAYIGDTIVSLIKEFGKGKDYYKKIYAWEPSSANREKLQRYCKGHKNIELLPYGLWSEKTTLSFSSGDSAGRISAEGTETVPVDTIDNLCGAEKVTFIKMDIEGSEIEAAGHK